MDMLIIVFVLFLILACTFSAQYWAKKCFDELRALREDLSKKPKLGK